MIELSELDNSIFFCYNYKEQIIKRLINEISINKQSK